jgi:putative DNA primase/helicase
MNAASSENVRAALSVVPAQDRPLWLRMAMAVKSELGEDGFDLWNEWSKQADSYNERDALSKWESIRDGGEVTIKSLFYEARRHGWRTNGDSVTTPPSAEEIAERKRKQSKADAERERLQVEARGRTKELLNVKGNTATHPYALTKRLPLGPLAKRGPWPQCGWTDALLFPIYQPDWRVWSIEAIGGDGKRSSLKNSRKSGGFYPFGDISGASKVLIGEGVATVAAGVASDGSAGAAAMSAGNLLAVATWVREVAASGADIVILADNDVREDGSPNTGVEAARKAAVAVGGRVAIPEMDGLKCDFWTTSGTCGTSRGAKP